MSEKNTIIIGDYVEFVEGEIFDISSTFRLRAKSIDRERLWASKDRSAEFMGDIWSLFVDAEKEERIKRILHSVCVELIENSLKYGCEDHDYNITVNLCLKKDELLVYVENRIDPSRISELEDSIHMILKTKNTKELFKQKMKEAKAAKKEGKSKSQLGFIRILMQNVKLAWQIETGLKTNVVTVLARISLAR